MGLFFNSSLLEAFLLLFISLNYYFYLWGKKKFRYFEERGVQYIQPYFIDFDLWKSLLRMVSHIDYHKELYFKLKGAKIGGFYQFFTPFWSVRDPEMVERVLIKDFSHFHDRGIQTDEEVNPMEGHLFFLSGEKWRALRSKLSPTFTSGKLKWMFSQLDSCVNSLLQKIQVESAQTGGEIEAKDLMARFTTDVIGSCVFGLEPSSISDPNCKFRRIGREIFRPKFKESIAQALRFLCPKLCFSLKLKTIPTEVNDFFVKIVSEMFHLRKSSGKKRNDFVQLLLQLKEKGSIEVDPKEGIEDDEENEIYKNQIDNQNQQETEVKIEMTDNLLTAQAFVFFIAGFETSATSLSFALYNLAKNEEAQERAREEVREVKRRYNGEITYQALKEMKFMENCLNESMRLYPPIPLLLRECTKTITFQDGTKIEKGSYLMIPVIGIHSDPDNYKNPEIFRPERFEEGEGSKPGTFIPFGDGPRICIGKRFAMVELKLALAKMLDAYSFHPSPKSKEPIKLNPGTLVPESISGLWVKFKQLPQQS